MEKEIYLCGVSHLDIAGPDRLRNVLNWIEPDYIAIASYDDISEAVLKQRRKFLRYNRETTLNRVKEEAQIPIDEIRNDTLLTMLGTKGYDIWIPYDYAKSNGAQIIHLEDESSKSILAKRYLYNILGNEESESSFASMLRLEPDLLKKLLDCYYESKPNGEYTGTELEKRNRIFSEKINNLDGKVLAITGRSHIFGSEPTLQTLLRNHNLTAFDLIDAKHLHTMMDDD